MAEQPESIEGPIPAPAEIHESWFRKNLDVLAFHGAALTMAGTASFQWAWGVSKQVSHVVESAQQLGQPLISAETVNHLTNSFNLNEAAGVAALVSSGLFFFAGQKILWKKLEKGEI